MVALFVISVIAMNILANKTLIQTEYLALDGGILDFARVQEPVGQQQGRRYANGHNDQDGHGESSVKNLYIAHNAEKIV